MTTGSRTDLLRAAHFWPNETRDSHWSAAIKNYVNLRNSIPTNFKTEKYHGRNKILETYDSFLLAKFSASKVEANLEHFHPFGFLVYVLETCIQSDKSHKTWIDISIFYI